MLGVAPGTRLHAQDLSPLDKIAGAGIQFVRWGPRLNSVSAHLDGKYDWSAVDPVVNRINDLGMKLVFQISGYDNHNNDHAPQIAAYGTAAAQRYGEKAMGYEGGNEPDHFIWDANPTPQRYADLLKRLYASIKTAVPSAVVWSGGLGGMKADWAPKKTAADFAAAMYSYGVKGSFDVFAFHPYTRPMSFANSLATKRKGAYLMQQVHQTMVINGDGDKKIGVTEFGWNTGGAEAVNEAAQAEMIRTSITWMRAQAWVGPIAYFDHVDDPNPVPANVGDYMGLWRKDWTPKAALATFTDLCKKEPV